MITLENLTENDKAFILMCRKIGFGCLDYLSIENGEPKVAKKVVARVDFSNQVERDRLASAEDFATSERAPGVLAKPVEEPSEEE